MNTKAPLIGLVLLAIAAGIYVALPKSRETSDEAAAVEYVRQTAPAILQTWDADAFLKNATKQFKDYYHEDSIKQVFAKHKEDLGDLVQINSIVSAGHPMQLKGNPKKWYGVYVDATFQNDRRRLEIDVLREDGQLRMEGFSVLYKSLGFKSTVPSD